MGPALAPPEHETSSAGDGLAVGLAAGGEAAVEVADAEAVTGAGDAEALVTAAGVKLAVAAEGDRPADPDPAPQAHTTTTMAAHIALDLIRIG